MIYGCVTRTLTHTLPLPLPLAPMLGLQGLVSKVGRCEDNAPRVSLWAIYACTLVDYGYGRLAIGLIAARVIMRSHAGKAIRH